MGLIVTFGKMADCKYDGGSIDYNGAEVSVRNGRICGSRGFFFFSDGSSSMGLDSTFPLSHSTSVVSAQMTCQSASQ